MLAIYKCFARTHLEYGDIIHDQAFKSSFHQKTESLQCNAALAIAVAIKWMPKEKIPQSNCQCRTRNAHNIPHINVKHQIFKNSYFQATIIEWNKLDSNIRNSETLNIFKPKILKFIRPTASSIFCCQFSWFLLSFHNYSDERLTLLCQIRNINPDILRNNNTQVNQFFLYGDKNFTVATNFKVLSSTIEYILATKRFDEPLFH